MMESRKPGDGSGTFLDHDRERTTRLPFMAQEQTQLERKMKDIFDFMNNIIRDANQLSLKLED
jgi:hypothetical protein